MNTDKHAADSSVKILVKKEVTTPPPRTNRIYATRYRKQKNESYTVLTPSLDPPSSVPKNPKQRSQD